MPRITPAALPHESSHPGSRIAHSCRRLRLALVGLRYGLAYLPAIAATRGVELVALAARGSRDSRRVAGELGLPLYTSPAELLAGARPDAAIVAVPPDVADTVACPLLAAGAHVLCEFPLELAAARAIARTARRSGARFELNPHFSRLRAPTGFIRHCRRLGPPVFVQILCHERTLFVCLDTALRAFGRPFLPRRALPSPRRGRGLAPGGVVLGTIAGAPAAVQLTPLLGRVDDGSDVFFGQRISAAFSGTTVTLIDSFGPVLVSRGGPLDLRATIAATPAAAMASERARANHDTLRRFVAACHRDAPPDLDVLAVARAYSATVDRLMRRE